MKSNYKHYFVILFLMEGKIVFQGQAKDGTPLLIRYPTLHDVQMMLDYINTLSKEQTFIRMQGEQLTYEFEEKFVSDMLKKIVAHRTVYLLVFSGEKLIASADVNLDDRILKHNGIFGITVAKEYRGKGIGTLLLEKTIEEAIRQLSDLRQIVLTVYATNTQAIAMYEKFGFKEYGLLPEGIEHKGTFVDYKYMYKRVI